LKTQQLEQLLTYRLSQAHETLREAKILLDASATRGAINRAYYAMFYALLALLATKQLGSSKHSGAIALFDREFVKSGKFPRELSRALHLAFDQRQRYDYGEVMTSISPSIANQSLKDAEEFIGAIERYLYKSGFLGKQT
jgi:uncharacterized protein (UPF0332 family)